MTNQRNSVWVKHPDLHERAITFITDGLLGVSLGRAVSQVVGVAVSADAIRKHLSACNGDCRRHVRSASPLETLTEPSDGYAASVVATAPQHQHPKGWEPHVEISGSRGTVVAEPTEDENPDKERLLRKANLDPTRWRIVGRMGCRMWQAVFPVKEKVGDKYATTGYEKRWLYYHKFEVEEIDPVREADTVALIEEIRTHAFIPGDRPTGDDAFVVALADPQMGKGDGDGVHGTTTRLLEDIGSVERRVADLRKIGRKLETLYLFGVGDLIENCADFYPQQTFRVQLNHRDQVKVMRRLIVKMIERWSPMFDRVVVGCVGGNHGERRKDGKSFTDFADNDDVAIFEQVEEIVGANPSAYGHVSFRIPKDELALTFDVAGEIVGITHGHLFRKGKAMEWWAKQAHGQQPIGDARILITGHYHHLLFGGEGAKTHIQCPALEGASDWYRNISGQHSNRGLLTLRVGKNVAESGFSDLEIV